MEKYKIPEQSDKSWQEFEEIDESQSSQYGYNTEAAELAPKKVMSQEASKKLLEKIKKFQKKHTAMILQ